MTERKSPDQETSQNNPVEPRSSFKEVLIHSATLIGHKPVTLQEKLALLGSICMDFAPEKIDAFGRALRVEEKEWHGYLDSVKTNRNLYEIHQQVLTQLEIAKLNKNLKTLIHTRRSEKRIKRGQGKHYVLKRLLEFQQEHPGETVNLSKIADEISYSREGLSNIYHKLAADHNLPPINTPARYKK